MSDESLRRLLDRLERLPSRDEQVAVLKAWMDTAVREHEAEREARELETLGKLGGG